MLVPFEPPLPAHGNGNGARRRRRAPLLRGVALGFILGSLLAATLVSRIQWLNLPRGWWGRPVLAAGAAGVLVGAYRRDGPRAAAFAGALAGVLSLWTVYAAVRLGVRVLWVERSIVRVVTLELLRLAAYGAAAGAAGAAAARWVGDRIARARR